MKKVFLLLVIFSLSFLAGSQIFAATGICNSNYEDSAGIIKSADDWCTRCKGESYNFCVDGAHYSFGCKKSGVAGLACSCDESTAKQETCSAGCSSWWCSDYGCYDGQCNQAKTCLQLGGNCCSSGQACTLDKLLGASDCTECCKDNSKCSLPCTNPSKTDKICTPGCTVDQDPDCGCSEIGNDVCPPGCTSGNDPDCLSCVSPVKGDKICTSGCTVDQDPDCGCKSGDYYCGVGCDYTNDSDCAKTCSQRGGICCPADKICRSGKIPGVAGCDECCEDVNNCIPCQCLDGTACNTCQTGSSSLYCDGTANMVYNEKCQTGASPGAIPKSGTTPKGGLEVDWPDSPMGTPLNENGKLTDLIKYLYEWGISLGGFAAFIALIIAGFQYLTSAGNAGRMRDAMDRIKSAGLGLILLFGSFLILNTINPQLTELKMPTLDPGERADGLTPISIQTTNPETKCTGATIFSGINYNGSSKSIPLGQTLFSPSREIGSVIMGGTCKLTLYTLSGNCKTNSDYGSVPVPGTTADISLLSDTTQFSCAMLSNLPFNIPIPTTTP